VAGNPGVPTNVILSILGNIITVSWTAPTDNGYSVINGYSVFSMDGISIDKTSETSLILPNRVTQVYVVSTNDGGGQSNQAVSNIIVLPPLPGALPATPKILAPVLGDLSVILSWTAVSPPAAPVTSYKVTRSDNSDFVYESSTGGASGSYTINTGLTAGTPITFTVTSVNANGECLVPASIIVSPVSNPEPPAHFVAYVGTVPGTVFLYWIPQPPSDGGTPVTGYVLTYNGITINLGPGVLKFFDNVAPEQGITFRLVSVNKVGSSIPIEAEIFEGGDVTAP
jgi:hypothetical protein